MRKHTAYTSLVTWLSEIALGLLTVALAGGPTVVEAGTSLGWSATITTIFQEVRLIGFVCLGGAIIVAGIELLFHRHLDRLGQIMAALGVGSGLIVGGSTAAIALTGAAGADLTPTFYVLGRAEAWGDVFSQIAYYGTMGWAFANVWLLARRRGH